MFNTTICGFRHRDKEIFPEIDNNQKHANKLNSVSITEDQKKTHEDNKSAIIVGSIGIGLAVTLYYNYNTL